MNVLYYTNRDIKDWDVIPGIIQQTGNNVITQTTKFDLSLIREKEIDFIVSDRARFLIKKEIIDYLPKKIINLHPSFLPWNRGYHPNYWSIKEGTPHGVTLHFIDEDIDTGDIIAQTRLNYSEEDTLKTSYERLRRFMVELFRTCWPYVSEIKMVGTRQKRSEGTLHYKKDFDGEFEKLPNGWNTKIKHIQGFNE